MYRRAELEANNKTAILGWGSTQHSFTITDICSAEKISHLIPIVNGWVKDDPNFESKFKLDTHQHGSLSKSSKPFPSATVGALRWNLLTISLVSNGYMGDPFRNDCFQEPLLLQNWSGFDRGSDNKEHTQVTDNQLVDEFLNFGLLGNADDAGNNSTGESKQ